MIRAPRSLLARILVWHGVAVVLTALAVSAAVYLFLDLTADQFERQTLRAQVVAIRTGGLAGTRAMAAGMSAMAIDTSGRRTILGGSPPPLTADQVPRDSTETYFTRRSRRAFYAGLSVPVTWGGQRRWIVALQNLDHPANAMDDLARQFLWHGAFIVTPLLLLLLGIDAVIIRRALAPVRRASALVGTIDPARPDVRILDPAIPAEVQPLAQAINTALDRLTDSLRMQREFTADAAHELRTPITLARVRVAEIADPALRSALVADLDRVSSVIGHLLDIAELDSLGSITMERIDLSALAAQAAAAIVPLVVRKGQSIELLGTDQPSFAHGHAPFLMRALGALLENAVAHTPSGTAIRVDVRRGAICVIDNGPGIAGDHQPLVFQRFWRRDRSRGASAGLGLAIVQRVALLHGGAIHLHSEPGATAVTLTLPPG